MTIRIRLLVCSIDKAQEIGLDWWRRDSFLSTSAMQEVESASALEPLDRRRRARPGVPEHDI